MPGNTSMAVAPAAGAGEPGSGSGETARHAAPRGAGCPSYELLSKYRGVLMGVQILLIMAFHYTEDLSNAADHFNGPAQVFYDYIGSSGVDMFLMISGLGLYYSWKRNPDAGAFYRKRLTGVHLGRYMLQLPLVMVFMFLFWVAWSMALSPLSAISRDFSNLLKTLGTPFFWLSGILFDISGWPRTARLVASFNPVTWVVQSVRDCFIYNKWFFTDWESFLPFLFVLLIFVVLALHNYHRLYMEVPDVL